MNEASVKLDLTKSKAVVLYEFLSRFSDTNELTIEDQAEERVLWEMLGMLEKSLVKPFDPKYKDIISRARDEVRDKLD